VKLGAVITYVGDWRSIYGAGWCARMAASVEQLTWSRLCGFRWARARLTDCDLGSFFLLSPSHLVPDTIFFPLCHMFQRPGWCVLASRTCFGSISFPDWYMIVWCRTVNCGWRRRILLFWGHVHTYKAITQFWLFILSVKVRDYSFILDRCKLLLSFFEQGNLLLSLIIWWRMENRTRLCVGVAEM
jgi:hypothetical protein